MNVTRDVIRDLLPVYLSGEASPDTRALVETYLAQDPELAERVRREWAESLSQAVPPALPPELEVRSLRRTRRLLAWQKWLFGLAIAFTAVAFTSEFSFEQGRVKEFHFLLRDYPLQFGASLLCGAFCWIAYFTMRRRLRAGGL